MAPGEVEFTSDEDDELDKLHCTHRTELLRRNGVERRTRSAVIQAKHRLALHVTQMGQDIEYTSSSADESDDTDSESEGEMNVGSKYSASEVVQQNKIKQKRSQGMFLNEVREEEGTTSSDEWPIYDTIALKEYLEIQEGKPSTSKDEWTLAETLSLRRYKEMGLHLTPKKNVHPKLTETEK